MILCLNLGSSSLKCNVFASDGPPEEGDEVAGKTISTSGLHVDDVVGKIAEVPPKDLLGIGHRVVFGGEKHVQPEIVTEALLADLETYIPLVPLHLPRELGLMRAVSRRYPNVPQVACFDTAFHATMPSVAKQIPIPRAIWKQGVRRYGFHGLSCEYIVAKLGADLPERTIVAHLGNGASLTALRGGSSVDTTMGFTPLSGLMMGTRPGDLDPGVLIFLMRNGDNAETLNQLLEEQSGLLGVSEISSDVAVLLDRTTSDVRAAEALQLFTYIIRKHVGAMTAVLGGLDLLVFAGGIGEHAAPVRNAIVDGLAPPPPAVRIVATDENLMVARHTYAKIRG